MNDEERLLEVPADEDENVGDGVPKKKIKRKKSKEEREADRKVVLWTLIVVLGVTMFFWLWPKIQGWRNGVNVDLKAPDIKMPEPDWKYIEYKL